MAQDLNAPAPKPAAVQSDQELTALGAIVRYLNKLSEPERERVMVYLADRYPVPPTFVTLHAESTNP
jgi:hypothetical protein